MQRNDSNAADVRDLGSPEQPTDGVIPVVREALEIGRRTRETGRVRVHKHVDVRETVVEDTVRYDEVEVQRVPVNAVVPRDVVPRAREENGVLIVPVLEEVVVAQKVLMLKEELRITRRQRVAHSVQRVPLRSERLEVERVPSGPGAVDAANHHSSHGDRKMHRTLVGVYDSAVRAQQVREELLQQGFDEDEVHVSGSSGATRASDATVRSESEAHHEGGIIGFFRSLFGADDDETYATRYSSALERGNAVVTVDADSDDQIEQAQRIMNRYEPLDIDADMDMDMDTTPAGGMTQSQDWAGDRNRAAAAGAGAGMAGTGAALQAGSERTLGEGESLRGSQSLDDAQRTGRMSQSQGGIDQTQSVPVVEEALQVGKRTVSRGGVRVFTHVQEQPVEETVQLREERAQVERTPVDRAATEADLQAMREGVIEVRETAEEPVVAKQARVVEEVRVGKQVEQREQTVRDTVRHTEVQVEQLAGGAAEDFRRHWQSSYGSQGGRYEDYAPAYQFGSSLRSNERYRGRDWSAMEADVRRDWEARSPGTWERMKDSIRHAWDRATN
jgi:uncharacterized protein (TIGR02271 family)